ncbi:MAG: zinc-dependent metalloprotease [Lacibacter sp.]
MNRKAKHSLFFSLSISGLLLFTNVGHAQQRPATDSTNNVGNRTMRPPAAGGVRPYSEVVPPSARTDKGLFTVHKVGERYLLEIPDSLLTREILVVNRIAKAAAGSRAGFLGYAGDMIGENVIRFEKGPNSKLFLYSVSHQEVSKDTSENGMYRSVMNSNLQPIVAVFDIKSLAKDSAGSVIDFTDYLNTDNDILYFEAMTKRQLSLGMMQPDKSYISGIKSFPLNIEIRTIRTYMRTPAQTLGAQSFGLATGAPATYELNSSFVLLPKAAMKPRYFDNRVGYFATGYVDFDANPQGVKTTGMITRWRLEPKPEDVDKYKRGELVEPRNPIVYYIDPATPKKWVPYLIQGVNDWQAAFEKAGWKNAIIAKEAPKNDSEWSVEDARHNVIVYKPSDVANASGPNVHDPRSGEIMETHINWYHNIMELVHNWYMVQTAAVDPKARYMQFDDELMGQLIRFVSSHEVGHTLGLRHNFGSSSTVPVEKLRDNAWLKEHGHTPSIMDYARFNYVAQPEDNIDPANLFPRIGEYDKWAIEWGYRWFPETDSKTEKETLNKWIINRITANPFLWFGTETDPNDPRCQNEDLGDNAVKAGLYGIKNLQRILPNLVQWTKEPGEDYTNLKEMYNEITLQFNRYLGHVAKNVGGILTTPKTSDENGVVIEFVSKAKQREAISFFQEQLFATPTWLLDKNIFSLTGTGDFSTITTMQSTILNRLISVATINKLLQFDAVYPAQAYTAIDMLNDLKHGIWSELRIGKPIDLYRRNLQKLYVERLISLTIEIPSSSLPQGQQQPILSKSNDGLSIIKGHIQTLLVEIRAAILTSKDAATKLHLQDMADRIGKNLDKKS